MNPGLRATRTRCAGARSRPSRLALADRVPAAHLEWAAHAVVGYLVEAVLNWLEFGDPGRDEQLVAATNHALRAGVRAWADSPNEGPETETTVSNRRRRSAGRRTTGGERTMRCSSMI